MTPPRAVLPAGTRLGEWTIEQPLGRGGMGTVYRARGLAGAAAVKVIAPELARRPLARERFEREAVAARAVAHRNVVRCLGSGAAGETLWIAFELVPGGSLAERVERTGPLPWREAAARGAEIAHGLAAIHARGLVHRDLKPANVLLGESGEAKVSDLGLAGGDRLAARGELTRTGELLGTAEYMAPEQVDGARGVDARADLYALGCTLYALVSGAPPFGSSVVAAIAGHVRGKPASLRSRVPGVPGRLDALVLALLAKDPDARPGPAAQVARELEAIAASDAPSRRFALLGALGGALALGALAALAGVWRVLAPPSAPSPAPRPEPTPSPASRLRPSPASTAAAMPAWWKKLPAESRPASLPPGIHASATANTYVCEKDGSSLVFVPGGTFRMGRPDGQPAVHPGSDVDLPVHDVQLSPYFLGKLEVSNAQFRRFTEATAYATRAETTAGNVEDTDNASGTTTVIRAEGASWLRPQGRGACLPDRPVVQVSWRDASAYAEWAGLRLPTEAEWERAAGWDGRRLRNFPWGDESPETFEGADRIANVLVGRAGEGDPLDPVTDHPRGASPVGALNMCGNAREWVLDAFDANAYKITGGAVDPCVSDPEARQHVQRGGSFRELAGTARTHFRYVDVEDRPLDVLGFRVALSADGGPRPRRTR